jgi:hypothetical protein
MGRNRCARVSRNIHAPLRLPGMLSTAGHCDQSGVAVAIELRSFFQVTSSREGKAVTRRAVHVQAVGHIMAGFAIVDELPGHGRAMASRTGLFVAYVR